MKTIRTNKTLKILPMIAVLFWAGCEDLDFPDPNNPTDETATIQTLVTGAEAVMRQDLGVYLRDLLVVGREAYYLEPADPRYTASVIAHGKPPIRLLQIVRPLWVVQMQMQVQ